MKLGRIWLRSAGREAVKLFGWLAGCCLLLWWERTRDFLLAVPDAGSKIQKGAWGFLFRVAVPDRRRDRLIDERRWLLLHHLASRTAAATMAGSPACTRAATGGMRRRKASQAPLSAGTIDHADRKGDANPTASLGQGGPAGGRAWGCCRRARAGHGHDGVARHRVVRFPTRR